MKKVCLLIVSGVVLLSGCIEFGSLSAIVETKIVYWSYPVPDYYVTEYNTSGTGFRGVACSKALKESSERQLCSNSGYDYSRRGE